MDAPLTPAIVNMIQAPGTYGFICAMGGFPPFLCHTPHGTILHTITESEHDAMIARAHDRT